MKIADSEKIMVPFRWDVVERPWGYYDCFADNEETTVKMMNIKKGESLSLQFHYMRDQLYMAIDEGLYLKYSTKPFPDALKTADEIKLQAWLSKNMKEYATGPCEVFCFKRRHVHTIEYKGPNKYGRFLDIAYGYNDEEDIVRLRDKYGRK